MKKSARHTASQTVVVGVSWYDEPEWRRVKSSAADPELFEATFAEWTAIAEDALAGMRKAGIQLVKVPISASELLAWCLIRNKVNDASARAAFVSEKVGV